MKATAALLNEGATYLVRIEGSAAVETPQGPAGVDVAGELVVVVAHPLGERRSLRAARFALATSPLRSSGSETGVISVMGAEVSGAITPGRRRDVFVLDGQCRLHYPQLDVQAGVDTGRGCYHLPTTLPAGVTVHGSLEGVEEGHPHGRLRIVVTCAAGEDEAFSSLVLERVVRWHRLDPSSANCHPGLSVNRRRMAIQPVGFRSTAGDPNPSGSTAGMQLATSSAVWGKACIDLAINPTVLITNATLKTSSDLTAIRAAYTHPDPNTIEVFFVQNSLPATGGGNAGAIGVASQKVVVAEPNGGNPVLVAHELGHALGLLHPPGSDPGSVMQPTGSAMNPGTQLVSHFMSANIAQPALQTLTETCCLSHDIGDHFIRDFPEDVGAEPSDPLPPGRTRYSMSNVWNRVTDSPGPFGGNGPDHQHPLRFQADGVTPHTNFLWARVDQREVLQVRDAVVRFYMKHPGTGGGAANLRLLGQAAVTSVPANVRIPWQVPPTTPNHSCVFAVVRSPAEPEDDPTAMTWQQFEALARADNDWAQRNLDIRQTLGAGNLFHGAPVVVRIPEDVDGEQLLLHIDARAGRGLQKLVLMAGDQEHDLPPGKTAEVELRAQHPYVPLTVRGVLPRRGHAGPHGLDLDVGLAGERLVGYGWQFHAGRRSAFLRQITDTLLGALDDLVWLADLDPACRISDALRGRVRRCTSSGALAAVTDELGEAFAALDKQLDRNPHARAFAVGPIMRAWFEAHDQDVRLELLMTLAERLQMVAWASATFGHRS